MTSKKLLSVWYGGGIGNNRNTSVSVGQLSYTGFIFPKLQSYEYKQPFKRSRNKAHEFFKNTIDPQEMAKSLRQVNYVLALGPLRQHETLQNEKINLENNFYWLNELAEILHPYLDAE